MGKWRADRLSTGSGKATPPKGGVAVGRWEGHQSEPGGCIGRGSRRLISPEHQASGTWGAEHEPWTETSAAAGGSTLPMADPDGTTQARGHQSLLIAIDCRRGDISPQRLITPEGLVAPESTITPDRLIAPEGL